MSGGQYYRLLHKLEVARANARRARASGRLRRWRYWQRQAERVFRCDLCGAPGAVECRLPDTELYQPPDELLCAEHCYSSTPRRSKPRKAAPSSMPTSRSCSVLFNQQPKIER
jgi:hypothetical protein